VQLHPAHEALPSLGGAPLALPGTGHDLHSPVSALVALQRELHAPGSERSCVHLEFDLAGTDVRYEAGDHVGVFAENSDAVVAEGGRLLGWDLDTVFSLVSDSGQHASLPEPFPCPISLRVALARYTDLLSSPKKAALLALAQQAASPEEAARLRHLAGPQGKVRPPAGGRCLSLPLLGMVESGASPPVISWSCTRLRRNAGVHGIAACLGTQGAVSALEIRPVAGLYSARRALPLGIVGP
jgi:hypothetical protein